MASVDTVAMVKQEAKHYWIGFDLGGTKMQCSLFDHNFKIVHTKRRRTKGEVGVDASLERIASTIQKTFEEAQADISLLKGIGIGCPGPVDWDKGVVEVAVNLGWKNVAVGKYLQDAFGRPVAVLNDVDAGVYGEYTAGAAKGARSAVGIFPGTGIGGGCVYDGQILRGKRLSCMEIGHIKLTESTRLGASGMYGSLETEASRLAIASELIKLAYRGEAPKLLDIAGTDIKSIRSRTIAEAIEKGDKEVKRIVEKACEQIGYAIANVVLMMCPDYIVLGGGMVEAMPELFLTEIAKVAKRSVFECYREEFTIGCAKLGDDAGSTGAAYWVAKTAT